MPTGPSRPDLSVIAPAHDERDSVGPLVRELIASLGGTGLDYEVIVVDDGSTDGTDEALEALAETSQPLRVLRLPSRPDGRGHGQSAAFRAGILASRAPLIATLDADGQNDPADLPRLIRTLDERDADLVQGDRTAARCDGRWRRLCSGVGRSFRRLLLGDTVRDTGCSLRIIRREIALALPLELRGMHRFIPYLAGRLGARVVEVPVGHRPRAAGRSKYGAWNRALPGLIDCLAVRWMRGRHHAVEAEEIGGPADQAESPLGARPGGEPFRARQEIDA